MTTLRLQPQGYGNSNLILEKLHHEAIEMQSIQASYIPRTLIAEDSILGEDRLSQFNNAYPVNIQLLSVEGYDGPNSVASMFGHQIQSSASFAISRRGWQQLVGRFGTTVLPNRPSEGDLLYIPMTKGLVEIKFVDHQTPFYQLGQYYSYKLTVELFRYSSEKINTGIAEADAIEAVHSTDTTVRTDLADFLRGADNVEFGERTTDLIFDTNNPFGEI